MVDSERPVSKPADDEFQGAHTEQLKVPEFGKPRPGRAAAPPPPSPVSAPPPPPAAPKPAAPKLAAPKLAEPKPAAPKPAAPKPAAPKPAAPKLAAPKLAAPKPAAPKPAAPKPAASKPAVAAAMGRAHECLEIRTPVEEFETYVRARIDTLTRLGESDKVALTVAALELGKRRLAKLAGRFEA